MAMVLDNVRKLLAPDEVDYARVARLGQQLLPHLKTLIEHGNPHDASKAAYLLGMLKDARAATLLRSAARHKSAVVRAAVAGGLVRQKHPAAAATLMALLSDRDAGVRKLAIKSSVASKGNAALVGKLRDIARRDPSKLLRTMAQRVVNGARIA